MQKTSSYTVDIDGRTFTYILDSRKFTEIRIRVMRDGTLRVSAPFGSTRQSLEAEIIAKKHYIFSVIDRYPNADRNKRTYTLNVDGRELTYTLERKNVKNINLHIKSDGTIWVSAPFFTTAENIESFIINNSHRILTAVDKVGSYMALNTVARSFEDKSEITLLGEPYTLSVKTEGYNSVRAENGVIYVTLKNESTLPSVIVGHFLDKALLSFVAKKLDETERKFFLLGVERPAVRLRRMKSCWGTCHVQKQVIMLNKSLRYYPEECVEYVLLHEMCHFVHPNHSQSFKTLLSDFLPDWEERKARLEALQATLGL
ncbi:MAG: M48 family metallopeptidase [Clostridiales bacterium]|nr:M48 family metallopeptidase [Clostridiales bacterium]